ncbi:hypothetical protein GQ53DRAFT_772504 [Thozetella sp. PMI_491]|nr:hypothetical protein GQ53DRAFT_772504 [Thozetella sp. PMI_491]
MAPQRPWVSRVQDFKVGGGKKRAGTDIATPSQKKQKTGSNPRPTLAPELDELNQFVETVAAEEAVRNPDTSFVTGVLQQDTDDDPGGPDLDILTDFSDEDSEISDSESVIEIGDDGAPFTFRMDPGVIDTLIAEVEHAHNTEPMENDPLKYNDKTFEQAPFCWHMLQWCKANDHLRPRLVELLLHPLVRSYQCRNAVGQHPSPHHDTLSKMEYFPLSEKRKAVPNVLGIYLLHGLRTQSQDPVKDPRYVGQGAIPELGEEALRHFLSILALAETVDMILVDTMSQLEGHEYSLRLSGLHKTTAEVVTLYRALARNPNSGFISRQSSRWRSVWAQVYGVKHHLEKSQLVMDPLDSNDLFYHIPRLEDGHKTSYDFRELLKTTVYAEFKHSIFRTKFWTVYLPRLLHRDVWEKITEFVHVPTFKWSDIVQIWHHASAQLIADGINCNLVFPGEAVRIVVMLTRHGSKIVHPSHSDPLPPWTYGRPSQDSKDGSQAGIRVNSLDPLDSSDSLGSEKEETQGLNVASIHQYEWPSEASRYKTVAASHDLLALTALNEKKQTPSIIKVGATHMSHCGMAQYRTSTLRILTRLMRDHHESQYDVLGLFIELSESWRATSSANLKHRFSWVLELLRTGSLPAQAELASQILQKRLSGSVFLQQTHPYNYKIRCSTRKFLNPDLSPEWTNAFLLENNALADAERDIQEQMDGHTIKGFCSLYGVLITQLWVQAMAEQAKFRVGFGDYRTSQSIQTQMKLLRSAARARGDRDALPSATAAPQKPSGSPEAPDQVEFPLRSASPEPDPPAVPRQRHISSRMQSAAFTYLKDEGDAKQEHLSFGDKGSMQVFQTIATLESMDTSGLSSCNRIPWTAEEHTFLQSLVPKCATWKEVYDGVEAEYPKGRIQNSGLWNRTMF